MRRWWYLPEGWLSLFVLSGMLLLVIRSVQQANWAPSLQAALGIMIPAAAVGLVVGFLLAWIRRFPRVLAHIIGVFGGLAWVVQLSGSLRSVPVYQVSGTVSYLDPALQGWKDLATEILIRMIILWRTYLRSAYGEDVVIFIVVLSFVAWMLGFLGAWFTFRSHWPWATVGLLGFVILVSTFYAPEVPASYFGIFAALSMVFLIYYLWRRREVTWQKERVRYPQELSQAVFWTAVVLSAILVVGTSFLPTTAGGQERGDFWDRVFQPWREVRRTWERLFSNVGGGSSIEGRMGGYGSSFELGGARMPPQGTALELRTNWNDYLRGISFDLYDGRGWTNTAEHGPTWPLPNDQLLQVPMGGRIQVTQVITARRQGGNMVFALAEPITVSMPAVAELSMVPDDAGFADIIAVRTRRALGDGETYQVVSYFSAIDKTSLREAGQDYPNWLRERYLQLPPTLPQRVRELGDKIVATRLQAVRTALGSNQGLQRTTLEIDIPGSLTGEKVAVQLQGDQVVRVSPTGVLVTSGLVNPYDAAEAIQDYLRSHYVYREDIPDPPGGAVDLVDYFLFEGKIGYCDYFASAMVVLARTQGIPARVARGYAPGAFDRARGVYVIPATLAHSWSEVFFPNYGWERFEPTAASYTTLPKRPETPLTERGNNPPARPTPLMDPRDRYREMDEGLQGGYGDGVQPLQVVGSGLRTALYTVGGVITAMLLAVGVLGLRIGRGLGRLSPISATYERMYRWAELVRAAPSGQPTPYETAAHLAESLPDKRAQIDQIASGYVRERFSTHHPFGQEIAEIRRAWRGLRWPLWGHPLRRLRMKKAPTEPGEEVVE